MLGGERMMFSMRLLSWVIFSLIASQSIAFGQVLVPPGAFDARVPRAVEGTPFGVSSHSMFRFRQVSIKKKCGFSLGTLKIAFSIQR